MDAFVTFAHQLADAAGAAIRPYFGAHGEVIAKGDASPVTIADRAAEQAMRALIEAQFPEHGIFGEEFGVKDGAHYSWVLDPIDGTRAFIAGNKEWGTLIALCEDGVPVLGVLDQPVTGERWVGVDGRAVYSVIASEAKHPERSGERLLSQSTLPTPEDGLLRFARNDEVKLSVRSCPTLSNACLSTTSRNYFTPPQAKAFVKLAEQCNEVIEAGDCYAYGLLARGLRDMVVDAGVKPYDILALVPIIEGAGGKITAWDGAAITLTHFTTVLAVGDAALHAEVMALLHA